MPPSVDGPTVVLVTAHAPDEQQRVRQRLESAGLRVVTAASDEEARRAAEALGAPAPPGEVAQMVVHHLKGPLTGLFATLEMLADGDMGTLTDRQRLAVEEVRTRAEELLSLVDDLLQVWRVESPSLVLATEIVAPAALLRSVSAEWSAPFERAGSRLEVETDEALPPIRADYAILRRLFGNLLHNALQHAGRRATVRLTARPDGAYVRFGVGDDGVGIPKAYRDAVFSRFARVPRPEGGGASGTGLGLAFCRLAVLAHGGTIWVESEEGVGTDFQFRIPVATAADTGGDAA